MANWSDLKAAVASIVKTNGNKEITGQLLQNVLNNIISNVGLNSTFAGIATPETNPGTPDGNVFYLATTEGTYSNFNGIVINSGEAVILEWKGSWVKKDSGFATQEKLSELEENTNKKLSELGSKLGSKLGSEGGTAVYGEESYKGIMWNGTSVISSNANFNAVIIQLYEGATYTWDNQSSAIAFSKYPTIGTTNGESVSKGFKAIEGQSFLLITLEIGKSTTVTSSVSGVFENIDEVEKDVKVLGGLIKNVEDKVDGLSKVYTKNGVYIKADGSEAELEATHITDIIPIDTIVFPFPLWTNALARSVEYYNNGGVLVGYYVGSSTETITINSKSEMPNITENAVYARFSNLNNNIIYAGEGITSKLFSLISGSNTNSISNLYINKPLGQGGTREDNKAFLNDFAIISASGSAMANIPIEGGKTYSIYRNYDIPYWRDNFLAIVFRDEDNNVLSHSNEFPFEGNGYQNAGFPPYTRTSYRGNDNCVVVVAPKNATRMTFNIKVSTYDFRNDGDVVVVKGFGFEQDSDELSLIKINGLPLKDINAREIAEKSIRPYINKVWACIGDSITEKNYWAVTQYHDYVANDLGLTVKNYGVSGTGYKQDFDYGTKGKGFPDRALLINPETDVCTIFGSVNDKAWYNSNLGEATDSYVEGVSDSLGACINLAIDNILSVCPSVKLGLITPIPSGEFPTNIKDNGMSRYADLIVEIGKLRGIPVLDLYHSSSLRPWDENFCNIYFTSDDPRQTSMINNVHPNSKGHAWFAPLIREFVKKLL